MVHESFIGIIFRLAHEDEAIAGRYVLLLDQIEASLRTFR